MAIDIKLTQDTSGVYTMGIENGDFEIEYGFDSAITVSLLTDQRATASEVIDPAKRRGWMGDLSSPIENRKFGSLLWLAEQSKLNTGTLNRVINYAELALLWMTEDGVAKSVTVSGTIVPRSGIQLLIIIESPTGEITSHYKNLWELTGNAT